MNPSFHRYLSSFVRVLISSSGFLVITHAASKASYNNLLLEGIHFLNLNHTGKQSIFPKIDYFVRIFFNVLLCDGLSLTILPALFGRENYCNCMSRDFLSHLCFGSSWL
jgi:hypothetical protein